MHKGSEAAHRKVENMPEHQYQPAAQDIQTYYVNVQQ